MLGMVLGLCGLVPLMEHIDSTRWPHVGFFLGLLMPLTLFCLVVTLCMVAMQALHRASSQYCPDCLQYMTRGARVCPFCGFRPTPGVPDVPPSRSL